VPEPAARRTLDSGPVIGFASGERSHAWLGIPYAQPPQGELRWRAPRPPAPWSAEREALEFGSPCPQYASPFGGRDVEPGTLVGQEDCLYLNVWAPRTTPRRAPVMVWIHGGGNTIGEGGFYNGSQLAARHGVIVLTVNYRLGALGWFHHPVLTAGASPEDASGNYGTLDLIRVLEWVRDNIEAFGGDPANVTIFGESAGGANVMTLLISPRASGLFHRAIVQSGGLNTVPLYQASAFADSTRPGHESSSGEVLLRLLQADGRASDRASARAVLAAMSVAETAAYLRGKDTATLLGVYDSGLGGMYRQPRLLRDGHVIHDGEPKARLARGDYNRVPIILGSNRDESKLFMFASDEVLRVFGIPLWLRDAEAYELSAEYQSKAWKVRGVDSPAEILQAVQGDSVFAYRWDWDEEPRVLLADLSVMLGAAHGLEIPFVFGHWNLGRIGNAIFSEENRPGREALSDAMMSYWVQFASTGAPGRGRKGELPNWTAWDMRSPAKFMVLDTEAGGGLRMEGEALHGPLVIQQIDSDPRLPTQRDKCRIFRELSLRSDLVPEERYRKIGTRGCRNYPLDEYPWPE
jgi:para-nitrobenzyl esterase